MNTRLTRDVADYRTLPDITGHYRTLPDITGHYRTLPDVSGHYRTLPDITGHYRTLPDITGHYRTLPDITGHYRTLPDITGHYRTLPTTNIRNMLINYLGTSGNPKHHAVSSRERELKSKEPTMWTEQYVISVRMHGISVVFSRHNAQRINVTIASM